MLLDRADKLNAMHRPCFEQLRQRWTTSTATPTCGRPWLTGAGRAFSAGGDIESFERLTDVRAARDRLRRWSFDAFDSVARLLDAP